jgi:hypothetical protein
MDESRFSSYMALEYQPGRFMRLLIYLLAMMTGFSAAEAARPMSSAPATVAQGAIVAASVISAQREVAAKAVHRVPVLRQVSALPVYAKSPFIMTSPVSRRDIIRE